MTESTTSRWFVEVVPLGEATPAYRYCVEASRWQSALKRARELRGEKGSLARFAIDQFGESYRARDPSGSVSYSINPAPRDAPLTMPPKAGEATAVPVPAAQSSSPDRGTLRGNQKSKKPRTPLNVPEAKALNEPEPIALVRPKSEGPPKIPMPSGARRSSVPPAFVQSQIPGASEVPNAMPSRGPLASRTSVAPAASVIPGAEGNALAAVPRAPLLPDLSGAGVLSNASGAAVAVLPEPESLELPQLLKPIVERFEPPREGSPLAYQEMAYSLTRDAGDNELASALKQALVGAKLRLAGIGSSKFVRLAVFEQPFIDRPSSPPIAFLEWKDWNGEETLAIRGRDIKTRSLTPELDRASSASSVSPAAATLFTPSQRLGAEEVRAQTNARQSDAPSSDRIQPRRMISIAPAPASGRDSVRAPSSQPAPDMGGEIVGSSPGSSVAPREAQEPTAAMQAQAQAGTPERPASSAPNAAVLRTEAPLETSASPEVAALAAPASTPEVVEQHGASGKRGAQDDQRGAGHCDPAVHNGGPVPSQVVSASRSEDLIGKLFDQMHDLHFMSDLTQGAAFVVSLLSNCIPCAGIMVHIFDINRREFVVVRARGPHPEDVLLQRTSGTNPDFVVAMKRESVLQLDVADLNATTRERWEKLGISATSTLCGPLHQHRRYLGIIELAATGANLFAQTQLHALEYVCRQFAEFVASRPLVVDADVVLSSAVAHAPAE